MVSTPWEGAVVEEEFTIQQHAGDKGLRTVPQLLEVKKKKGDALVAFAYSTDGTVKCGPFTLRLRDLERLRAALAQHPALEESLSVLEGGLQQRG